jgi:hypothetical protein
MTFKLSRVKSYKIMINLLEYIYTISHFCSSLNILLSIFVIYIFLNDHTIARNLKG